MKKYGWIIVLLALSVAAIACDLVPPGADLSAQSNTTPRTDPKSIQVRTPEPTSIPPTPWWSGQADGLIIPTQTPFPQFVPTLDMSSTWLFTVAGVRQQIPMQEVDYAQGGFTAPWPELGHVLAEPGKLMVDSAFPQSQIDGSRGAIRRTDPGNQYRMMQEAPLNVGCEEGSLIFISVQEATLEFERGFNFSFRAPNGSGAHIYIKCPFADGEIGSDAGENIQVSGYRPGYGLVTHFSPEPNGGFVSSNGALQALQISQSLDSCGGEGCLTTYVVGIDSNTGAYSVSLWDGNSMTLLATNWWQEQATN